MNIESLLRFRLIKNSKNPTYERNVENKHLWRTGKFENNSGVLTGEINNITVVDLDFYKHTGTNKFIETFNDYIDYWNTYTVKTGRGGFHLYFKYDEEVALQYKIYNGL